MIIPMLCVTIFVILVVWFLLPRVARLMIHTPTAISIFVCLSMVRSEERFSRNAETDLVCRLLREKKKILGIGKTIEGPFQVENPYQPIPLISYTQWNLLSNMRRRRTFRMPDNGMPPPRTPRPITS